jgi:iron complex outermembrane recepter protein
MKSLNLFATLFFLLFYTLINAQNITGYVHDNEGKKAEFVTVLLLNAKDSVLVKGAITDETGRYLLENIASGGYFISATMVGFAKTDTKPFDFKGDNYTYETLVLKKADKELAAVTVTSTKPMIEIKADKLVMNVEGTINATGMNGLDILRKAPSVQVNQDDNILVKGKSGVRIYIDGKLSPLAGRDLASILKSMTSADIEAIEIITNPSAKFDAAGDLGIINIRLKKNRKLGTNGNVAIGPQFGITPKLDASLSLNYRDKKMNLYGNYSFNQGIWHSRTFDDQILRGVKYNKVWNGRWMDTSHNVKTGIDYFINSKSTLGFNVNFRASDHNGGGKSTTFIGRQNSVETDSATLISSSSDPQQNKNLNATLNYRFADTSGHELNIDADYGKFTSRGFNFQPNLYEFSAPNLKSFTRDYMIQKPVDITVKSFKIDYEQPFGKGKLGYGIKLSDVKSDNVFDLFNLIKNAEIRDTNRSNTFVYTERIYAGYLNYNLNFNKKWSLQAGLRAENTKSLGNLTSYKKNELDKVDTTYLNIFPSGALTFQASEKHSFALNYSRRINRPSYQDLNPFIYTIDELVYQKGNPFLRPEYGNSFKLTHTYRGALTTSLGYVKTKSPVVGLRLPFDESRTYFVSENLDYSESFNLDISLTTPVTKWWEVYVSLSGYSNLWKANLKNGLIINNSTIAANMYAQNTFKARKGWSFELSGWYNSPYRRIDYNLQQGMVDVGVQKKFWNDNASLKVSFSDVFNMGHGGYDSEYAGLSTRLRFKWESQQLRLNFTYRFGSNEIKGARNRKAGSEEELNRIKG